MQVGGGKKGPTMEPQPELQSRLPPQPFSLITPVYPPPLPQPASCFFSAAVLLFDLFLKDTWTGGGLAAPERLGGVGWGQPKLPSKWGREACWVFQDVAASSVPICSYKMRLPASVREACVMTTGVVMFD